MLEVVLTKEKIMDSPQDISALIALKGWARAISTLIQDHESDLVTGAEVDLETRCEEQPRVRLARLCHQVEHIHDKMVVPEIYAGDMPNFDMP